MPIVEDIISAHAGAAVRPGDLVTANIDRVYLQDGNTPTVQRLFEEHGFDRVFDRSRIGVFFDHAVLIPDRSMANRVREAESFARQMGLQIFRAGEGISHVLALELGWFAPGSIVIGADSHTCTGGVAQCLALGMGASDAVAAMVTGEVWLRVPDTVWLDVVGAPSSAARSKDVMLYVVARWGDRPFLYRSIEWCGAWVENLSSDAAATVANMTVELAAKCAFLPPGPGRAQPGMKPLQRPPTGDPRVLTVDITDLPPFIARPHIPYSGVPIDECRGQPIDYVFIGSCTNSRIEDLEEVARVFADTRVAPGIHCLVTPGSRSIYLEALRRGWIDTITRAGAMVTPPGCGACVGTQGTIPSDGTRVLSTMNRNFQGRMGNPAASIWLASPLVAAHTATRGEIPGHKDLT